METIALIFSETPHFYESLDACIKLAPVAISFDAEKPGQDSKLWARLKKCRGWDQIEAEFKNVGAGKASPLTSMISPSFAQALTGMGAAVILAAIFAVWSVVMYALYKDRDVDVEVDPETGKGKVVIKKTSETGTGNPDQSSGTA